ncbi:hypothetical protein J0S82_019588 [Galemys pyrenaicus]|uniref:Uncharacterized protein n=1 Tax=Galemys pyrenaicus TaxID=202257 RepID=A0A8J6DJP9_GALPY|nr:hypothetical protein J0S82_019588 [Galemys pyrenaicus]
MACVEGGVSPRLAPGPPRHRTVPHPGRAHGQDPRTQAPENRCPHPPFAPAHLRCLRSQPSPRLCGQEPGPGTPRAAGWGPGRVGRCPQVLYPEAAAGAALGHPPVCLARVTRPVLSTAGLTARDAARAEPAGGSGSCPVGALCGATVRAQAPGLLDREPAAAQHQPWSRPGHPHAACQALDLLDSCPLGPALGRGLSAGGVGCRETGPGRSRLRQPHDEAGDGSASRRCRARCAAAAKAQPAALAAEHHAPPAPACLAVSKAGGEAVQAPGPGCPWTSLGAQQVLRSRVSGGPHACAPELARFSDSGAGSTAAQPGLAACSS